MRMMEIIIGIIGPAVLVVFSLGVLGALSNSVSTSMVGLLGAFFMMALVWGLTVSILKSEAKKAQRAS